MKKRERKPLLIGTNPQQCSKCGRLTPCWIDVNEMVEVPIETGEPGEVIRMKSSARMCLGCVVKAGQQFNKEVPLP